MPLDFFIRQRLAGRKRLPLIADFILKPLTADNSCLADCCVYENISVSASVTCNLLARRIQIKIIADQ